MHASNLATCALHPPLVPGTEDLKSTGITCRPCVKYLVLTSKMHRRGRGLSDHWLGKIC